MSLIDNRNQVKTSHMQAACRQMLGITCVISSQTITQDGTFFFLLRNNFFVLKQFLFVAGIIKKMLYKKLFQQ